MHPTESPIFTKTYDLSICLLGYCDKFPKHERFRLARRLEDSVFLFHEYLLKAVRDRDNHRQELILADIELDKLRFYLRLCFARSWISISQYEHISRLVIEVGKLLGGWMNKAKAAQSESNFCV